MYYSDSESDDVEVDAVKDLKENANKSIQNLQQYQQPIINAQSKIPTGERQYFSAPF